MDLTMLISSSSYPKIIYGMPLIAKDVQIRFEFEFKFKFELNQKRKWKKKKKRKGSGHMGWPRARTAQLTCPRPKWAKPTRQRRITEKKEKARAHSGQGPWPSLLLGPGRQKAALFLWIDARCTLKNKGACLNSDAAPTSGNPHIELRAASRELSRVM